MTSGNTDPTWRKPGQPPISPASSSENRHPGARRATGGMLYGDEVSASAGPAVAGRGRRRRVKCWPATGGAGGAGWGWRVAVWQRRHRPTDRHHPAATAPPPAQAGMLAGAGALSGCSGRGRRICQGLGVSGVVIDSTTPATVLNRSGLPRSVLPRGRGRLFDTLKLWVWQLAPSWLP
jgi:hypothetical protein